MIKSFRHKGLEQYFTKDVKKALDAKDLSKISRILDRLERGNGCVRYEYPGLGLSRIKR